MEVGQPSLSVRSDDVLSEGMLSDSEQEYASLNAAPPSFNQFDRWQAHIGLKTFGDGLHAAAQAVFPIESQPQYTKVYVLMIRWEHEELNSPVSNGIHKLFNVFKDIYQFEVDIWKIPDTGSHAETNQRVLDFVKLGGDSDDHLKIVYYAGDAKLTKNRSLAWTSGQRNQRSRCPTVQWSSIQNALEQAQSDVLVLLDCCHAGTANNEGNGVTELIAASAYSAAANDADSYHFTKELEIELRELSNLPSFSIGNLYQNIFSRIQSRKTEEGTEHPAPVYLPLTQEDPRSLRSIRLSVQREDTNVQPSLESHLTTESSFAVQDPGVTHANGISSTPSFQHSSALSPAETPRIAFAIRLLEDLKVDDLSSDKSLEWLRKLSASVAQVKIEARFHNPSSLLIVSVPICMSIYMPKDPAVINLGPITSSNQVSKKVDDFFVHGLPTPRHDQDRWTFDNFNDLRPSLNLEGLREPLTPPPPTSRTNGFNGINGSPAVRFQENAYILHSNGVRETRPTLQNDHSSQFSILSGLSEEPESIDGLDDLHHAQFSEMEESHRIPTRGPLASEPSGPQSKAHAKIRSYTDDRDSKVFPRISRPVELLRNVYDCVVIGSGYGGGVAASRMARAGQTVCLLERGKERWPGEYPSGIKDAMEQLHVSGDFAPGFLTGAQVEVGDPTGLYHLIFGKGQNAFVGNGLGGTSLLNANIFLEADGATMKMDCWPEELRHEDSLDTYYKRAADVLQPEPYPEDWPALPKLSMLERQAKALGLGEKFKRPRQTTRFIGGPNSTGVEMYPSALTGMDCTGVNDGSKSTTLVNYLSDAWNWGAEMFCECEVRYIKKHPDPNEEGYLVFFAWHGSKRGVFHDNLYEDLMWVHAKKCVFLGAGSIGTTEILLRSKKLGLSMSDKVGTGMSGNGDILAFGYNTDSEVNAIGREYPSPYKPVGPTITGVIDNRTGHDNPLDGFVIEEGAVPQALAPLFQTMLEMMPGNQLPKGESLISKVKHSLAQQGSRILGPYFSKGSIEKTQVYLIMSHDANQAILTLKDDKPVLEFLGVGRSERVQELNDYLRRATQAVGGTFVQSPFYAALGQQEVTVHPIGGACMSKNDSPQTGVTNHFGEVFTGVGNETHHGLIVTDGAVIPTALGVNPFATITALAERSVEHAAEYIIKEPIDLDTKNDILDLFAAPHQYTQAKKRVTRKETKKIEEAQEIVKSTREAHVSGFGFSEVMSGYIHVEAGLDRDAIEDYETAAKTARGLCEEARFFLSVKAWDTEKTVNKSDHRAMLTGTFTCAGLKGSPFMVQRGNFHLFSVDQQCPGTRNLTYDFDMTSTDGKEYHFHGYKIVDSSCALGPMKFWSAASTLYVTITEKTEPKVLGRGMMHIKPMDFLSEMLTLKPSARNLFAKVHSTMSFMGFFAKQSASLFLAPLTWQQYPSVTYSGYINDTSPDATIKIIASDGVQTLLHVWEPRAPGVPTQNLFMIPGASVDQQIFALPTIEANAVNYFTRAGYRVFVTVHRICMLMVAEDNWTTFDARLDIKGCYDWIRSEYGTDPIYTISHCMGAVAYSCGLLDGTIPSNWVKGISTSQVFCNPIWSTLNMAKLLVGPIPFDKLYNMIGGSWFSCSSSRDDSYFQQALNQLLRFYPTSKEEICNNVSCHRSSLIFGRLWNHRNLNEATHRQINRFFGGVNMTCLHLLMQMGHRGFVTDNAPLFTNLATPSNLRRLKGIPMMLFSGSDNKVLTPEATDKTYGILRDMFGPEGYSRNVIQGYGHLDCWMGRRAYKDVYPIVREEVDRICRDKDYVYKDVDWKNDWQGWKQLPKSGGDRPSRSSREGSPRLNGQ